MKKGLLLSVVASGLIYAGGDIAPVAPVQPTAAPAACDFYGSLGARYEFIKDNSSANKWGKEDNTWKTTLVLGVNKELGYGFGFGAEVAATTDLGLDIATPKYGEDAELSQLFLTYKAGNTAIKAGRQALPKSLSPWAWTDSTVGRLDTTYQGVVIVNTDLPDTTLVGAWIAQAGDKASFTKINGSNKGLYMLAAQYKGFANTTLTGSVYFIPKNDSNGKAISAWGSVESKVNNFDLGLQVAYAKAKAGSIAQVGAGTKATIGVAGYVGTNFNGLDAKLTLAYIKNGNATLNLGGTSGFWGNVGYSNFGGDVKMAGDFAGNSAKQKIAKLDLGYKLPNDYGKVYAGVAYDKVSSSTVWDKSIAARVGYSFTVKGVKAKVEYRYTKNSPVGGNDIKIQKVRVEGIYKF